VNQKTRVKLHFGPYPTPRFTYRATVLDESWGHVPIVGITDARIPWPVGQRGKHKSPVLYEGLVRAVRCESAQAVMYWWGVGMKPVTRWRKALRVERMNPGHRRLRKAYGQEPWSKRAIRKAVRLSRTPEARAKVAAAKIGKTPPPHVLKALRTARKGKRLSAEHRRKIGRSLKGPGIRVNDKPWEAWEDSLLLLPMRDVVARTGRTKSAVRSRRRELRSPHGGLKSTRK
jgi:hypothetical protein